MPRYRGSGIESATKAQRIVVSIFFLIFIGLGVGLLASGLSLRGLEAVLKSRGKHVQGVVESRYVSYDRRSSRHSASGYSGPYYNLVVRYEANHIAAHRTFRVAPEAYNQTTVDLLYLPEDPSVLVLASPGGTDSGSTRVMGGIIAGSLGLLCLAGCWIYWLRNPSDEE